MRIVSLVPSWTEYIVDLGCGDQLVGRTKFCVRAPGFESSSKIIGGTKSFHIDQVKQLEPDLIIACREENSKDQVEACLAFASVLTTDVRCIHSALEALVQVATAVDKSTEGEHWRRQIEDAWGEPRSLHSRAAYVIWNQPRMLAGYDTYIHHVMQWWGFENACPSGMADRYPSLAKNEWEAMECDVVLLSSEPFPFEKKHLESFETAQRSARLVDGEAFSWYGSRMLHTASYLAQFSSSQ